MRDELRKIWSLFTSAEKRKAAWMLALVVMMAVFETAGVISIVPFLSVLGRPDVVHENPWLRRAYEFSEAVDVRQFIVILGIGSMVTVVLSSAFKTITLHTLNRFVHL